MTYIEQVKMFFQKRSESQIFLVTLLLLVLLASYNSFIQDDAFISFRYASNFVSEHELTWNVGEERVEGYTNFFWTILIALSMFLGQEPVMSSIYWGLLFATGTLFLTYRLSWQLFNSSWLAFLSMTLLGTNYTFSAYATGGLETQMQTCLIVACTFITFSKTTKRSHLMMLSLLAGCALLTRLDSAIFVGVLFVFLLCSLARSSMSLLDKTLATMALILPISVLLGLWFWWKLSYYGDILPNTYYVKAYLISPMILARGGFYIYDFLREYLLMPFVFLAIVFIDSLLKRREMSLLLGMVILWLIYLIKIGGDFMEFRLLVPILPFSFILISYLITSLANFRIQGALIMMIVLGSLFHAISYRGSHSIESISKLNQHLTDQKWIQAGLVLGDLFAESEEKVTIATTAAGAIPYYSQLRTIDMYGLNDKWIARNGSIVSTRPGHQRTATVEYLMRQEVNLVLGHPSISETSWYSKYKADISYLGFLRIREIRIEQLPERARVLEIPLDEESILTVLYLVSHPLIDKLIEDMKLTVYEIK